MIDKLFKYLILLLISYSNILFANEFVFEASEIDILEKGNITKAKNGVKIFSNDGIEITGNELFYDKVNSTLKMPQTEARKILKDAPIMWRRINSIGMILDCNSTYSSAVR